MKRYIFIHDLETGLVKVISHVRKRDVWGFYFEDHYYKIYNSKHKGLVCDCQNNVFTKNMCNHRRKLLKMMYNLSYPAIEIEHCSRTKDIAENY